MVPRWRLYIALIACFNLFHTQVAWAQPLQPPTPAVASVNSAAQSGEAQPSQGAPPAAPASTMDHADASSPERITLQFAGSQPGLTLFGRHRGAPIRLCTLDCTLRLAPGAYRFGVSIGNRKTAWASEGIELRNDEKLSVSYVSPRARRAGG